MNKLTIYPDPINYRYSFHPEYGTSGYDGEQWQSMTDTEWVSTNSIDYTFTEEGKYIVVVWAAEDSTNVDPNSVPIAGWSVDVSDDTCKTDITGYDVSGTQEANSPLTLTVNAENSCSETLYYRYSMHPDYGTSGYDNTQWQSMTSTEWIPTNTTDYTFTEYGHYIVVVWATEDPNNYDPTDVPIIGWSMDIE